MEISDRIPEDILPIILEELTLKQEEPQLPELLPIEVEVVGTWKEESVTCPKILKFNFTIDSIFTTTKETFQLLKNIPHSAPEIQPHFQRLKDLISFYEENINLIVSELGVRTVNPTHGGLYTFFKFVAFTWSRIKDQLNLWYEDHLRKEGALQTHSTISLWMNSLNHLYSASISSTSVLYRPFLSSGKDVHTKYPHLKEISERQFELEQLMRMCPLMLLILREKKLRSNSREAEHLELFTVEEAEQLPEVAPFWYKYNTNLTKFSSLLFATYATLGEYHNASDSFRKYALSLMTAIKCSLDSTHASKKGAEVYHAKDVDPELLQRIWNLLDVPWIQAFHEFTFPPIAVSQLITIPPPRQGILRGMPITARIVCAFPLPFSIAHLVPPSSTSYVTNLTRVISSNSLTKMFGTPNSVLALPGLENDSDNSLPSFPVILHFHGGGFVSGSSAMHENYLREWAISTGAIIISVDYRLAPEYKFPIALDECYHVYKWLMTSNALGMKVSRIALVGDSAGGNLVAGVTIKAIEEGFMVPDGNVLYYPALDLCRSCNPSRLLFKNDPLVPLSVMKVCRQSYFPAPESGEDENAYYDELAKHPLISPMHISDTIVSKFPPTHICAGEFDPLVDECVVFARRLKSFNKLVKLYIYEGLPHGFLSVSNKTVPEGNVAIRDGGEILKQILKARRLSN